MKQIYKFPLVFLGVLLFFNSSFGQGFTPKEDRKEDRMRSSYVFKKITKFADLFNYPADIDVKSNISENADINISFASTNEANLFFDGFYYSSYSGQFFYINVPENIYGCDTLTITIKYKGTTTQAKIIVNTDPIKCVNDSYDLGIGDTLEVNVVNNDQPRGFFDFSTFEIITNATSGSHQITGDGIIEYISDKNAPNYTVDKMIYRIADADANYDTAIVYMNVHKNPYASKIFDYLPGTGQFVNSTWADTAAAKKIIGDNSGGASLGGFGGYVIAGFDQAIVNRDDNAYGVDFTVVGNAFGGWGEPAAVQVMKDVNKNGLPDDTWYELAGSEYYFQSSVKDLTMTYYNPKYNGRHTIPYSTDKGFNGAMRTNGFHSQQYYPDPNTFGIDPDSISYNGTFTRFLLDKSKPNYIMAKRLPAFGYADSRPANRYPTNPTNPYFKDENGNPTDGFDLEWAVDINGNHVPLDTVHFVKVYSTVQEDGGWLGEISPEVLKIAITSPNPDYVPKDYELHAIGAAQLQVLKGSTLQYEGLLFKNGVPQSGTPNWESDSLHVATIDNTGVLTALENGQTTIHFSAKSSVPEDSLTIEVVELTKVVIELEGNSNLDNDTIKVIKGTTEYIHAEAIDNRSGDRNRFVYETYNWTTSDNNIATIENGILKAKNEGIATIIAQSTHNPELKDTIVAIVGSVPEVKAIKDTIAIPYYERTGSFANNDLFETGVDAIVYMKSIVSASSIMNAEIKNNILEYSFNENSYGFESIIFTVESFGIESTITLVFQAVEPDNFESPKQVLFVNGGQFGNSNSPTNLMTYLPEKDTTIQIDNYLAGATSVQDMLVDGNYAFVSADYYITKYDITTRTAIDSIYTQDLNSSLADGQGTEDAGLNHKMAIYQNLLLVTRQNSSDAPEDGYNVRIYNKGDLSFIKKIPVSDQATDIVVVENKAYVMINGGYAGITSSMAEIDLEKLELIQEVDLDTKGLGVMQMIAKNNKIYCIRLGDYSGLYNSGITIYDINSQTAEFTDIPNQLNGESSPLAIEPMTNDTLFIKKDMGYVAFNTLTKTVGTDIHFPVPSYYTQDLYHVGRGSVYDSDDNKYYIAYGGWFGNGVGQIYNNQLDSIGDFKKVKESPESMRLSNAMPMNTKPYIDYGAPVKTYNEDQTFSFYFSWSAYKDQEDGKPTAYIKNPAKYDWLTLKSRKVQGVYDQEILEPTTFNIPVQIFDEHGTFIMDTMKITINPVDDAPFVANPIADITVDEDAIIPAIDLTNVFDDVDNNNTTITKAIISTNDESLLSMNITDNMLHVTLKDDKYGELEVIIEANSNTKTVTETFNINVNAVDDAPIVTNPIADITIDEDATIAAIDLSNVFSDIDNDNAAITKAIISTNDESLLSMSITDNKLNVTLKENQSGELQIVIEASSNTKTVTETFNIIVNTVNDAPIVSNTIANQTVDMNANNLEIDLSEIFADIDGDNLILSVDNNSNTDLVTTQIENNKLTLQFIPNQYGDAIITIMANDGTESITTSFNVIVNNTTGINNINEYQIETYPNPTSGNLNINSPKKIKEIVIMNTNGVVQRVLNVKNTEKNYQLDLNNLPTGIYFITIIVEDSRITRKVIKQ